ncbi:ABC transporter ATP-binding protein [Mycobacterium sp. ACS4331]|uniref:ABC transporter ATP-binding protein n=1 Tax=Mycobacterium sp. ACS4331 TaxID=1834121 RepID=UPI000A9522A6|nr:ABC transporter ATP-binding protein [Mycobacterium sp. ACS4331]
MSSTGTGPRIPLRLQGVTKRFGDTTAVDSLDLEVHPAEVLALLGPNGAGKTTTVEMCEGFIRPDAGTIEVFGLDPVADNAELRPRIGVMLQGGGGYPAARAAEMLNLVAAYAANPLDPKWLLETLGLTDSARTTYRRLSGGQQQRLALACALVGRPELVFLDEPTAGMDAHARLVVWELIDGLRRDGVTVVLTTHQLKEAEELADRIVIIDHGAQVAAGTPAELMRSGAEDQLRFSAPRMLDLTLLVSALPESYRAAEVAPGEYLVEGHIDPQVLATVTAWCARLDVLATDMRVEQRSLEDVFLDVTGRELRP